MNIHKLFPSKWLAAADLNGKEFTLVIESVSMVSVRNAQTNKEEQKPAIKFYRAQKQLIINKTHAFAVAAITGEDDTDRWVGHTVVLSAGIARNRKPTIIISGPPDKPAVEVLDDDELIDDDDESDVPPAIVNRWQPPKQLALSEMTVDQFSEYLKRFDWTYSYSDDRNAFERGQSAERGLLSFLKSAPTEYRDAYLAAHKKIYDTPTFTGKNPYKSPVI